VVGGRKWVKILRGCLEVLNRHLRTFLTIKTIPILLKPYPKMIELDHKNEFLKQILVHIIFTFCLKNVKICVFYFIFKNFMFEKNR
jgi:hypothetical protein